MSISYYISSGKLNKMYTLRQVEISNRNTLDGIEVVKTDYYVATLSTDLETAKKKAAVYTGHKVDCLIGDLGDIRRRSSEEMDYANMREEAAQANRDWDANFRHLEQEKLIEQSAVWPFGKYKGEALDAAAPSYIIYMHKSTESDALRAKLAETFPQLVNLPTGNGKHFGTEKAKFQTTVTLVEAFGFDGHYGWVNVRKYITETGELLTHMGSAQPGEIGERMTLKGTIKMHDEYDGEAVTKIIRPKVVAE